MILLIQEKNTRLPYGQWLTEAGIAWTASQPEEEPADLLASPDLELIVMTHSNALLACASLRNRLPLPRTVRFIVLLDSRAGAGSVKARTAGADVCMTEPFTPDQLLTVIRAEQHIHKLLREFKRLPETGFLFDGRYGVTELLGAGPHGVAFLAQDRGTKRLVTIKLLSESMAEEPERRHEFEERARQLQGVKAPELASVLASGASFSLPFVVFDAGKGYNLYEQMELGALSEHTVLELGLAVTRALLALRAAGQMHFDVKPENVLCFGHQYKLTDYGLLTPSCKNASPQGHPFWFDAAYAAPEFFTPDGELTPRSDVYSLGMLLYTAVTRENPYVGCRGAPDTSGQVWEKAMARLTESGASPRLSKLIRAMLSSDEEDRPRLRDLEMMLSQALNIESMERDDRARSAADEARERIRKQAQSEREQQQKARRRARLAKLQQAGLLGFCIWFVQRHYLPLLVAAAGLTLTAIIGYCYGRNDAPQTHFHQGPRQMFTCFNGHTMPCRTLDYRTVRCKVCGELTSPSYLCDECGKIYGASLWPLRDMTESECANFEERLQHCPYCASTEIRPTPLKKEKSIRGRRSF